MTKGIKISEDKIRKIKELGKLRPKLTNKKISKIVRGIGKSTVDKYLNYKKVTEQQRIIMKKRREIQSDYSKNPEGAKKRQSKYNEKNRVEINRKARNKRNALNLLFETEL